MTTIDALLRTIERHEREPFAHGWRAWRFAEDLNRKAADLFAETLDIVPFVPPYAKRSIKRTRERLRIAASMAMYVPPPEDEAEAAVAPSRRRKARK